MRHSEQYVSTSEVADHLGVTADSVRKQCRKGLIKGARLIGRQWFIPATQLKEGAVPDDPVTVDEVASYFGVSEEAVRRRCRQGLIGTISNRRGRVLIERSVFAELKSLGSLP